MLNLLGRLSGIATLTREYVRRIAGTNARIYDTRKTTPGWRRLEKYAVRCGGGHNHRTGLFDAMLIKDNHLALAAEKNLSPADAVRRARDFLAQLDAQYVAKDMLVEVEIDRLDQLDDVLAAGPDIVLLDNMSPDHAARGRRPPQRARPAHRAGSLRRRDRSKRSAKLPRPASNESASAASPIPARCARHRPRLAAAANRLNAAVASRQVVLPSTQRRHARSVASRRHRVDTAATTQPNRRFAAATPVTQRLLTGPFDSRRAGIRFQVQPHLWGEVRHVTRRDELGA